MSTTTDTQPKLDLDQPRNRLLMETMDAEERTFAAANEEVRQASLAIKAAYERYTAAEDAYEGTLRAFAYELGIGHFGITSIKSLAIDALAEWRANPALSGGKAVAS